MVRRHTPFFPDSRNLIVCPRSMNLEKAVYVCRAFHLGHLTLTVSQGADADDFNPDRFIDPDGQVTPAIADTKDGASVTWPNILMFAYSLASQFQKVIISLFCVTHVFDTCLIVQIITLRTRIVRKWPKIPAVYVHPDILFLRVLDRGLSDPDIYPTGQTD